MVYQWCFPSHMRWYAGVGRNKLFSDDNLGPEATLKMNHCVLFLSCPSSQAGSPAKREGDTFSS